MPVVQSNLAEPAARPTSIGGDTAQPVPPDAEPPAIGKAAAGPGGATEEEIPEYEPLTPELVEDEAVRGDFVLRWSVVLMAFLVGSTRITDTMTLLHIKSGQYLAGHGWLPPRSDVFSYTAADRPWINLNWGFDLLLAAAHGLGGFAGVSLIKGLLAAIAFGLLVRISRPQLPTWWSSICGVLALAASQFQMTAQPEIITLVGVAAILWCLHAWRFDPANRRLLYALVAICGVWSNLDSHMFMGLVLLLLFGMGRSFDVLRKSSPPGAACQLRPLWAAIGSAVAVAVVHPFGWNSLTAAWCVYTIEYPTLRELFNAPAGPGLWALPMWSPLFWSQWNVAVGAAALLALCGLVLLVLNRRNLEWTDLLPYCGAVGLALVCAHELGVAALVCCVTAALNGQAWYASRFRQEYTVDLGELIFSRGGRALTVLTFTAFAFLTATGRLGDGRRPPTGYGLEYELQSGLDSLGAQLKDSLDDRPFNFVTHQGDALIWLGQKVFVDNRVALYRGGSGEDLYALHRKTRNALRRERKAAPGSGDSTFWKQVFDKYQVTHVLPRLTGAAPDYVTLYDLMSDVRHWQVVSFGAATAVFYRADQNTPEMEAYRIEHKLDFVRAAFQQDGPVLSARNQWVTPPSFYERYLWGRQRIVPNEVQEATHLMRMAADAQFPQASGNARIAMIYQGIRKAQEGLAKFPDCAEGYVALGLAYTVLSQWDAGAALNHFGVQRANLRYLQAVAAFNQALVSSPHDDAAHLGAFQLYQAAGRVDLALRELQAIDQALANAPAILPDDSDQRRYQIEVLKQLQVFEKRIEQVNKELEQIAAKGQPPLVLAQIAAERGCVLKALDYLEGNPESAADGLEMRRLRAIFLLEAGRAEDAALEIGLLEEPARQAGVVHWREPAAVSSLTNADYDRAAELLGEAIDQTRNAAWTRLLFTLPPRAGEQQDPWPLPAAASAFEFLFRMPEELGGLRMLQALVQLEGGRRKQAIESFHAVLSDNPETAVRIPVAWYLYQLTGEEVETLPPSEQIPLLFEPEL